MKSQSAELVVHQPLSEIDQRGRMKKFIAQLPVESKVPARVIAQHLDGLPVGQTIQELEQAHAQHQDRFHRFPAVVHAIAGFQLRARADQTGIDDLGK